VPDRPIWTLCRSADKAELMHSLKYSITDRQTDDIMMPQARVQYGRLKTVRKKVTWTLCRGADLVQGLKSELMHSLKYSKSFVKSDVGVTGTGSKIHRQLYKPQTVSIPSQAPTHNPYMHLFITLTPF